MKIETKLRLSFYEPMCDVDSHHGVKLVRHVESGQFFVLKTLKQYDLRVFRYLWEHPVEGIPHIEELIEDGGILYLIEEFIPGVSLRYQIGENGPVSEWEACDWIRQICNILRPLHQLTPPIVHRDLKPENLILTPSHRIVLIDFNSAKTSKASQRKDTVLIGTVGYAAPEQYGFDASKPTADIYAIGVLLNELLTGCLPQEKRDTGKLSPVIEKCLQIDPANRYQTVDELLRALFLYRSPVVQFLRTARAWLPPGLRSRVPSVVIFSFLCYGFLFAVSCSIQVEGDPTTMQLYVERILFFGLFLCETLWLGNYRSIWNRFSWTRSKYRLIRLLGLCVGGFVIFLVSVILLTLFG